MYFGEYSTSKPEWIDTIGFCEPWNLNDIYLRDNI